MRTSAVAAANRAPDAVLQQTALMFGLLAAPVRLHILWLLAERELDVSTLAAVTGQSVATASHHLGKLRIAGLVAVRRQGKHHVYVAADPDVVEIIGRAIERTRGRTAR